eukprot:CAMPEP_0195519674 /NCGR_PEP_ID=MMETSP0794_2-20130614/15243_1 /TAXON_ID=515487 /ORGANISM="Stephanopyxis turris, Strain CCMP 815" /LENGTH=180 /DNA_ID=CAMNT_0040648865 /DNA_START=141 /DNA_END=680 /DNA_ORIENTATION=-
MIAKALIVLALARTAGAQTTNGVCSASQTSYLGDGHCDPSTAYNSAACNWDGGDCCEESCFDGDYSCGSNDYDCQDPDFKVCSVEGSSYLGDGYCDAVGDYNTDVCGWDGGDCCSSSCVDGDVYACGDYGYTCLDPDSSDASGVCEVGFESWIADGYCDTSGSYNTDACDWDGGDCCSDT